MSRAPAATPEPTANPAVSAVPSPTRGRNGTKTAPTKNAAPPAAHGAMPYCTESTYRSRLRTNRRVVPCSTMARMLAIANEMSKNTGTS